MGHKTDCFAYSKKACRVLRKLDCNSCGFYKTKKQYEEGKKMAEIKNAIKNVNYIPLDFAQEDNSYKTFYITFSFDSKLKGYYAVIYAKNEDDVRAFSESVFHTNWSGIYWDRQWNKNGKALCDKYGWQKLFEIKL